uniref:Peroxin-7 n=1 Tax=Amphimedon queenslandica TaxID=400682 RepID=A0A1X7UHF6_AMPQE
MSDGTLRLWDIYQSLNTGTVNDGGNEVLSCSWNKYEQNLLCSGGTDNTIKLWDIKQFTVPLLLMTGHSQSVRQIKFDPHSELWDTANPLHPLIQTISHHNEFTYSVDFSVHQKGLGRDQLVFLIAFKVAAQRLCPLGKPYRPFNLGCGLVSIL